jgi:hypothetical protein
MCEAKALIQFFNLKKDLAVHPFAIYKMDTLILTVSGVGKVAMAGAVSYTLALFKRHPTPVMLNIGIAGHKSASTGTLFQIMKILDVDSAKTFYPPMISKNILETSTLRTVSTAVNCYEVDVLYDMEAAAFYAMAVRFSSSELIQCIKIVSDNERSAIENINAQQIVQWVHNKLHVIENVINNLFTLSATIMQIEMEEYQQIVSECHFTASRQLKLKALLMRWQVLTHGTKYTINKEETKTAKEILVKMETELDCLAFFL